MIESIALLGRLENQKYAGEEIRNMVQKCYKENAKGEQLLAEINIDITGDELVFNDVVLVDLRPEHSEKMLYRGGNGNGKNPSPSAAQTNNDTLSLKIFKFFEDAIKLTILTDKERELLSSLYQCLKDNEQTLRSKIQDILSKKRKSDSLFLTLTFTKNSDTLFLADIPLFVKLFRFFCTPKDNTVSKGTCSICSQKDVIVAPASSSRTYKFFNLDKYGFFRNLLEDQAYASFPICLDCLRDIEKGKEYIENNLRFEFVEGLSYHLIPQFFTNDEASVRQFIKVVEGQDKQLLADNLLPATKDEQRVLRKIGSLDDTVAVNFLFLDTSSGTSAEKIAMFIQDVYPSRLSEIYKAQDFVNGMYWNVYPEVLTNNFFAIIRDLFPKQEEGQNSKAGSKKSKNKKGLDKYFLSVTQNIFENRPMNNEFIFSNVMRKIAKAFHNMLAKKTSAVGFLSTVKEAEMFVSFLLTLNLLRDRKEETMESDELFDDYFVKFKDLYNSPLKRGLFLLGVATRMFTDLQFEERNSRPFLTELKSFKMNLADFRGLVAKLQNKIIEYDYVDEKWKLNRMNIALANASKYLLQVDTTDMSLQEMNFYFAAGYHQGRDVGNYIGSKLKEYKENSTEDGR